MQNANIQGAIHSLQRFPSVLRSLVAGLDSQQLKYRPTEDEWSILEVVCHLVDEEKHDFPTRIQLTLKGQSWPPIDPVRWATENSYLDQSIADKLDEFDQLRVAALERCCELSTNEALLGQKYDHSSLGPISAGDLLFSWAAHDLLHLRQITRRLYQINESNSGDFQISYAGSW